jgi:hypothetical protein
MTYNNNNNNNNNRMTTVGTSELENVWLEIL